MATKISTRLLSLKNVEIINNLYQMVIYNMFTLVSKRRKRWRNADIVESLLSMRDVDDQSLKLKKDRSKRYQFSCARVDWTTNTNYYEYDDTISLTELSNNTLNNTKPMYVFVSNSRSVCCVYQMVLQILLGRI